MPGYHNPVEIIFSETLQAGLMPLLNGHSYCLITTPGMVRRNIVSTCDNLGGHCLGLSTSVIPNPTQKTILRCIADLTGLDPDFLVALGGGSTLDTAKAVAALIREEDPEGWFRCYVFEGKAYPESFSPVPTIAIPTTSGTGSEVTMWGAVRDTNSGKKYAVSHRKLYPKHAVMVPSLTEPLAYEQSVFPALDALSHSFEAIWNKNANPISDNFAAGAIPYLKEGLDELAAFPVPPSTRRKLMRGSLLAGMAFSNTKTALAHSISYPLTGRFQLPHGLACSFTLPQLVLLHAPLAPERVQIILKAMGFPSPELLYDWFRGLFRRLGIKKYLHQYLSGHDWTPLADELIDGERSRNALMACDNRQAFEIFRKSLVEIDAELV